MATSPLNKLHVLNGAHMMSFYGWKLPLSFSPLNSPLEEAKHTRLYASIFDISHMSRINVKGPSAISFISYLTRSNIYIKNSFRYSLILSENSFIIDDVMVHPKTEQEIVLVCNASQKKAVAGRIAEVISFLKINESVSIKSENKPTIAIQGCY